MKHLMSIIQNGIKLCDIYTDHEGLIITEGLVGDNQYNNFVELIKGLQGFDIAIDQFYF
jgi:hypothetical protein